MSEQASLSPNLGGLLELTATEIVSEISEFICAKCQLKASPVIEGVGFDLPDGEIKLILDLLCPSGVCSHRGQMKFRISPDTPVQIFPQLHTLCRQSTCQGCGFMFGRPMFVGFIHFVLGDEDWVEIVRGCPMCVTKTRVRFKGEPSV